ncbi:hypothetical protein L6164_023023 [Bauhinia variegata]|uniref:Uncharacterized protein n=1 Tax=Bauhinia variegata TaxID=167791 RepID=A0ACB9MHW7_BAUVA|nr:hypothetical protein L6164_023023 [Bauhinia variegata]
MRMSPQRPMLSLFIILVSLGSSLGSYQENKLQQTNAHRRLMKASHEHLTLTTKAARLTLAVSGSAAGTVNVEKFGAKGGDGGDDTQAFEKAWNEACSKGAVLVVPEKKIYHVKPITFSGPCQPNSGFRVYGTIKAWPRREAYEEDRSHWIVFENINNFTVDGGGTINGNGRKWWQNSCKVNKNLPCKVAPTAVTFQECKNLRVKNLRVKNAQQMHLSFEKCFNVRVSNLVVRAPESSPNTDGIHVTATQNILISNSVIRTGDDCISIVNGSKNVLATDITCGPGHGISIGSLGAGNSEAAVSDVVVNRAKLTGTTNGVRIKTWQGGSGYAKNIKFLNISMKNVSNPIIIDQNYCDQEESCPEQKSAVQLSNVVYQNIKGTSASEVAIKFDCSRTVPCREIYVQDVILKPEGSGDAIASCENVRFINRGKFLPQCTT